MAGASPATTNHDGLVMPRREASHGRGKPCHYSPRWPHHVSSLVVTPLVGVMPLLPRPVAIMSTACAGLNPSVIYKVDFKSRGKKCQSHGQSTLHSHPPAKPLKV